jgi:hypothetical protein
MHECHFMFKVVLFGDAGVRKKSFLDACSTLYNSPNILSSHSDMFMVHGFSFVVRSLGNERAE